ncbi:MAG: GTPase Era [bacterium]
MDKTGVNPPKRCGYVSIVGRPNVGKSTMMNHLLGQKLSITSRKPQTTRHNILGIKTIGDTQIVIVDTPGLHGGQNKAINRYMNRSAESAMRGVDVVVFAVDRDVWTEADEAIARQLESISGPIIVAINKIDRLEDKHSLLPYLDKLAQRFAQAEVIPVSALQKTGLDRLEAEIIARLPENPFLFAEDQMTDRSERFLAAEIVREKITRQLGAELPYEATVEIEQFRDEGKIRHIDALVLVERDGQKKIIIGEGGTRLKKIGQQARLDMERLFGSKVMLKIWVKVKRGWSDDERALRSLGYQD